MKGVEVGGVEVLTMWWKLSALGLFKSAGCGAAVDGDSLGGHETSPGAGFRSKEMSLLRR